MIKIFLVQEGNLIKEEGKMICSINLQMPKLMIYCDGFTICMVC